MQALYCSLHMLITWGSIVGDSVNVCSLWCLLAFVTNTC